MTISKITLAVILLLALQACSGGGDQLYCSRYEYLYNQLLESDAPPELIIRQALKEERAKVDANHAELVFMEQVLNDFVGKLKPDAMSPRDFCLKEKRFKHP